MQQDAGELLAEFGAHLAQVLVAGWGSEAPGYADLIAALIIGPSRDAWESVRAAWLLQAAAALDDAGYAADAEVTRERAMRLVRDAIAAVAGEQVRARR